MVELRVALCEGRHNIPEATDGAIFGSIEDPTNIGVLECDAYDRLWELFEQYGIVEYRTEEVVEFDELNDEEFIATHTDRVVTEAVELNIYVTGLTVALISVLNVCRYNAIGDINITLWHYDRESGKYYPQTVI